MNMQICSIVITIYVNYSKKYIERNDSTFVILSTEYYQYRLTINIPNHNNVLH